jgi:Secretion system C-terminal sorting domain
MKVLTTFLATLIFCAFLNPSAGLAQCTGPKKPTKLNSYANGLHIVWAAGTGQEGIRYRESSTTAWETIASAKSPYFISGLKSSTFYEVDITTSCPSGTSSLPSPRFMTGAEVKEATGVSAYNVKVNSVTIGWTQNSGETSYLAYREVGSDNYIIINPIPTAPYTLRGLKSKTNYEFYIGTNYRTSPGVIGEVKTAVQQFTTPEQASCADNGLYLEARGYNSIYARWANTGNVQSVNLCYKNLSTNVETCYSLPSTSNGLDIPISPSTSYEVSVTVTCTDGTVYTNVERTRAGNLPAYPSIFSVRALSPTFTGGLYGYSVEWSIGPSLPSAYTYELTFEFLSDGTGSTFSNITTQIFQLSTSLLTDLRRARVKVKDANGNIVSEGVSDYYSWVSIGGVVPLVADPSLSLLAYNGSNGARNNDMDTYRENKVNQQSNLRKKADKGILSVSPNPANDYITLDLPVAGFEQIQITSLDGRVVKQIQLDVNNVIQKIDCSDLMNGLYFLSAKGQGRVVTEKFVKN